VTAIRNGHATPRGFVSRAVREQRAADKKAQEQKEVAARRQKDEEAARQRAERQAINAYWEAMTPEQQAEHDVAAIAQANAEELNLIKPGPMKRIGMGIIRDKFTFILLRSQGKLPPADA
jgi:hypothetical protein